MVVFSFRKSGKELENEDAEGDAGGSQAGDPGGRAGGAPGAPGFGRAPRPDRRARPGRVPRRLHRAGGEHQPRLPRVQDRDRRPRPQRPHHPLLPDGPPVGAGRQGAHRPGGSPPAYYRAAAGVGTLGIMDGDRVDLTNLQRQILHRTSDIGRPKVESATETIRALNPDVTVVPYPHRITVDNIAEIIKDYDLIIDGSDNFETRYLVNDACYLQRKTNVHGSIFQFEGMATVFAPDQGPCYRCLYPVPPPAGLVPS